MARKENIEDKYYPFVLSVSIDEHGTCEVEHHKNFREINKGLWKKDTLQRRHVKLKDAVRITEMEMGEDYHVKFGRPYPQGEWKYDTMDEKDVLIIKNSGKIRRKAIM